jgi:2-iminobutanoate/2-iminopropanoate deaminase
MTLTVTYSDRAPRVYGPYSQAITAGDLIYTSGQIPLDPVSMEVVAGGIKEQATQAIANLRACCRPRGRIWTGW